MIEGLRAALETETRHAAKADSIAPLLAAARQRLSEATKSARFAALKRATEGDDVDPTAPDPELTAAQAKLDLFQEAKEMAEKASTRATSEVWGLLRGELQRRAKVAQAGQDEAKRELDAAWKKHRLASEAAAQAVGTSAHFPSENLKELFQQEIAACHAPAKANA